MPGRENRLWPYERSHLANVGVGLSCVFRSKIIIFFCALLTGIFFAFVWRKYEEILRINYTIGRYFPAPNNYENHYEKWLAYQNLRSENGGSSEVRVGGMREDRFLYQTVPVLCVILTKDVKRAKSIKNSWAQHCNKAVFYGNVNDEVVPVSRLPNTDPWPFLCGSLIRAWKTFRGDFKWVLLVDDRTFSVVENLRYLVASLDPAQCHYLGHPMKDSETGQTYNSGAAGVAISWKLLEQFVTHVPDDDTCDIFTDRCKKPDCILGTLFHQFGGNPVDTRDNRGRGRFNAFNVRDLLIPKSISVFNSYWSDSIFLSSEGEGCCSDYAITFHDLSANKLQVYEYSIYHLRPHFTREGAFSQPMSRYAKKIITGVPTKENLKTKNSAKEIELKKKKAYTTGGGTNTQNTVESRNLSLMSPGMFVSERMLYSKSTSKKLPMANGVDSSENEV